MERVEPLAGFQPGDRVAYAYLGTAGVVVGLDPATGRILVELESAGRGVLRVAMLPAQLVPGTAEPGSQN